MPPFARLEWSWGGLAAGVAATAPLLVGLGWCLRTPWPPMVRLIRTVEDRLVPLFAGASLAELALIAALAGAGEEALFRGVLQEGLTRVAPPWAAIVAVSLAFGVLHWVNATYAALATLVGIYLGGLLHITGNLLAPMVAHALYDLAALLVLVRVKPAPSPSVV